MPVPGAPTGSISSPADGSVYAVGQHIDANYSCADASTGPGISSCNGSVAKGAPIDTSTLGHHTFTVTAVSHDSLRTVISSGYTVAAAPSVSIASPRSGATYTLGEPVAESFNCSEGQFGSGLANCAAPPTVDTNSLGSFRFSVTASSTDGQHTTTTIHYRVILPSNHFTVSRPTPHRTGVVTFKLGVPGGGKIAVLETAPRSALPHPKRGRLTFATAKLKASGKSTIRVNVKPNKAGRGLLRHHRSTVRLTLAVSFVPINGKQRTETFRGLRVTK